LPIAMDNLIRKRLPFFFTVVFSKVLVIMIDFNDVIGEQPRSRE